MSQRLSSVTEALQVLTALCPPLQRIESLPMVDSQERVLSSDITSQANLPDFNRAAMDGYAVRSRDTRGASPQAPVYLDLGENALTIRTGLEVPEGFDAVVILEDTVVRGRDVEVTAEVYKGRNVSSVGEDVKVGDVILKEGHRLRPPDIALLAALGIKEVQVYVKPKVAIIPTGGELVPRWSRPIKPGEVYETNGLMTKLYARTWGCEPRLLGVVPDDPDKIVEAIKSSLDADMVIIIGGTSIGEKDYAPRVVGSMGMLLIHGIRMAPGKPTTLGSIGDKPVICLPGYPVAAFTALYLLARPSLKRMAHLPETIPSVRAKLARKVPSRPGYVSFSRVALVRDEAVPIMTSGSGILSSVARADGFVIIPEGLEGLEPGEVVDVMMIE